MSIHIRIPLLLDVVVVNDPAHMAEINTHPLAKRTVLGGRTLLVRLLLWRLRRIMEVGDGYLPTFQPRAEADQKALEAKLTGSADKGTWSDEDLELLAGYVTGTCSRADVGARVQQMLGRLFVPSYHADHRSYQAARLVQRAPGAGPVRALWWLLTRRLDRARAMLWGMARQNPDCIHSTTIALHNIVDTLKRMRKLHRNGDERQGLGDEAVVLRCLGVPPSLLRVCSGEMVLSFRRRPVKEGALLVFRLRSMYRKSPSLPLAFAVDGWNRCPAHAYVPQLLLAVWRRAAADPQTGATL